MCGKNGCQGNHFVSRGRDAIYRVCTQGIILLCLCVMDWRGAEGGVFVGADSISAHIKIRNPRKARSMGRGESCIRPYPLKRPGMYSRAIR